MKKLVKKVVNKIDESGCLHEYIKRRIIQLNIITSIINTIFHRIMFNKYRIIKNSFKSNRRLEIGPGDERIDGFETVNIITGRTVDYVCDASKKLPFKSETFEIIYTSHILEHIPWYQVETTLLEWKRIMKEGGILEIWVPDGLKICKVLTEFEEKGIDNTHLDGWYKFNTSKDPCIWASGRLFTYGDGFGTLNDPNWHRGLFTPRYLKQIMGNAGFVNVHKLTKKDVRGYDHGWVNLGVRGTKPKA